MDGIEAITPVPQGDVTLEEIKEGLGDEMYLIDGIPAIYKINNFALNPVADSGLTYAEYVAAHITEWTNIQTNLGFYWKDDADAAAEPDWDNLDWSVLTQAAE